MSEIAIVTDSVACLSKELVERYGIAIIPLNILVSGKIYRDWVDITPSQAYELFLKDPGSFKAAPPNPEECLEVFRQVSQKAKYILCVTLSLKISTLYNMARMAAEKAKSEVSGLRIELLDSETATAAEGLIALAAARAAEAGKSFEEVIETAKQVKAKVNTLVLLDTMRHVYRSGRVPRIAAQAAAVLNIRPIFTVNGSVHFVTAVRSRKNGIERILKMAREKIDNKPIHCVVMHAYDPEGAQKLKSLVVEEFNCVESWIAEFSPVMGYATGTGTLGLAFYADS
jgi:DegV family protein with EDD domain